MAVGSDYLWFGGEAGLRQGFCFCWVRDLRYPEVTRRIGATELERVVWQQLVGSGDGQRGYADRYFVGITRVEPWSLIVEDNGTFGVADQLLRSLSVGTTLVLHYRAADGRGRFLLLQDGQVQLEFDPLGAGRPTGLRAAELSPMIHAVGIDGSASAAVRTAAGFALAERLTGVALSAELLRERTYLLSSVPKG